MKSLILSFIALSILGGCMSQATLDKWAADRAIYEKYEKERVLIRICSDGTYIWKWDNKYWVKGSYGHVPAQVVERPDLCR